MRKKLSKKAFIKVNKYHICSVRIADLFLTKKEIKAMTQLARQRFVMSSRGRVPLIRSKKKVKNFNFLNS